MSELDRIEQGGDTSEPERLIAAFSRCSNFPKTPDDRKALVKGLLFAARDTGIPCERIVERARTLSDYCPTDYDLLTVARDLLADDARAQESTRNQAAEWQRQYGASSKVDINAEEIMESARRAKELDRQVIAALTKYFQARGKYDPKVHLQKIPLWEWYQAKEKLGFTLTPGERREMNR